MGDARVHPRLGDDGAAVGVPDEQDRVVLHGGEGVERTFQLYSPLIASIEVKRRGDVRRAKLYYLRQRSGKSARIKEKLPSRVAKQAASA